MFIVQSSCCPFMTLNWLIKKLKLKIEIIQYKPAEDYCTKSTSIIITKTNHEDRKKSNTRKQLEENNIHHENADNIYTKASLMHHVNEFCLRNERKLWRHRCFWLECNTHTDNTSLSAKGIGLNRYQRPAHSKQVAFVHMPIDLLSGGRVFCCFFFSVNTISVLMSKVIL